MEREHRLSFRSFFTDERNSSKTKLRAVAPFLRRIRPRVWKMTRRGTPPRTSPRVRFRRSPAHLGFARREERVFIGRVPRSEGPRDRRHGPATMQQPPANAPLVCHGHSRPINHLEYSNVTEDGVFLISSSKGARAGEVFGHRRRARRHRPRARRVDPSREPRDSPPFPSVISRPPARSPPPPNKKIAELTPALHRPSSCSASNDRPRPLASCPKKTKCWFRKKFLFVSFPPSQTASP
jgi:hypothetical protein